MKVVHTLLILTLFYSATAFAQEQWRGRVIYFALIDRFANGDPTNDRANGHDECNDPNNPHAYQGGDLNGLTRRLDYITDLGADTLWITPLYRGVPAMQGSNCGFPGYWVDFKFPYQLEVEPRYGTPPDFDRLLEDAHGRGMKVILDMVVNHAGYNASLTQARPDWFTDVATCHQQGNPDIYCSLAGLPDFDHRRDDVRQYLIDLHRQWLDRFAFDGIRMDTVKHVEPWYFAQWLQAMRERRDSLYVVGELLDEWSMDAFPQYLDAGFDGLFNFPLRTALIQTFAQGHSVDILAQRLQETVDRLGEERAGLMVNLLDNHDVPRFLESMPADSDGGERQRRYLLALTALLTMPGIPQIYYGNEIGMYGGHDPYNRRFMPTWAFSQRGREGHHEGYLPHPQTVFRHTQRLLEVRRYSSALRLGNYYELWRQNGAHHANVYAFLRSHDNDHAIVAFNNGSRPTDRPLPIELGGRFSDGTIFDDHLGQAGVNAFVVREGKLHLELPGRSSVILLPRR